MLNQEVVAKAIARPQRSNLGTIHFNKRESRLSLGWVRDSMAHSFFPRCQNSATDSFFRRVADART
jgi:hypothetical protein